jgi:hypothetical protein
VVDLPLWLQQELWIARGMPEENTLNADPAISSIAFPTLVAISKKSILSLRRFKQNTGFWGREEGCERGALRMQAGKMWLLWCLSGWPEAADYSEWGLGGWFYKATHFLTADNLAEVSEGWKGVVKSLLLSW